MVINQPELERVPHMFRVAGSPMHLIGWGEDNLDGSLVKVGRGEGGGVIMPDVWSGKGTLWGKILILPQNTASKTVSAGIYTRILWLFIFCKKKKKIILNLFNSKFQDLSQL